MSSPESPAWRMKASSVFNCGFAANNKSMGLTTSVVFTTKVICA